MSAPLGQHFLRDRELPKKIIRALRIESKWAVIELGPGHGELTIPLLRACGEQHARLVAVEKDPRLADELQHTIENVSHNASKSPSAAFELVRGDLRKELSHITASLGETPYAIVGNIPYYLTAHLFRMLEELPRRPQRAVFLVQREVAERVVALPPRMNKLAASVQYWSKPKLLFTVPRGAFAPAPNVDSAALLLETHTHMHVRNEGMSARYYRALTTLFAHPRKTIANNFRDAAKHEMRLSQDKKEHTHSAIFGACGVRAGSRPQELSVDTISCIAARLF